jgi:hypothetical protein
MIIYENEKPYAANMISVNGAVDYNSGPYSLLGLAQGVDVVSGGVGLSIERN